MSEFHIRWMIRRDMPEVLQIENESFQMPWTESFFIERLRERNCIGMVVENMDHEIVGFMIYELHKGYLKLLSMAVAKDHRRSGVGRAMVEKLVSKLSPGRRRYVEFSVTDDNLDAHLFLRSMGFHCGRIDGDLYVFRLSVVFYAKEIGQ